MFIEKDKVDEKQKCDGGKVVSEALMIGKDEVVVKKKELENKEKRIEELQKRIEEMEKQGGRIGEDEAVMKKEELEKMVKQIEEFKKVGSGGDGKFVVMHNHQILIPIDNYQSMKQEMKNCKKE